MSGFAGICHENSAEFLTKKFSGRPAHRPRSTSERQFFIILFLIFSFIVRNCARFFVNLGKQNGRYYPTDVLKPVKSMPPIDNRASQGQHCTISYQKECSHEHCKLCFPAHESKIVPRNTCRVPRGQIYSKVVNPYDETTLVTSPALRISPHNPLFYDPD